MPFNSLLQKINLQLGDNVPSKLINGISSSQWNFIFNYYLENTKDIPDRCFLNVYPSESIAESSFQSFKTSLEGSDRFVPFYLPAMEASPYQNFIQSDIFLKHRFKTLSQIINIEPEKIPIIICSFESLVLKNPSIDFFKQNQLLLSVSDIISPTNLAIKLNAIGYQNSHTVEEPGSFSNKGEIFDIYPINANPVRILYFDDMIEEIFEIDLTTQKSIRDIKHESIVIAPSPLIISQKVFVQNFRQNLPPPPASDRSRFETRNNILQNLSDHQIFSGYSQLFPLFFEETTCLSNLIPKAQITYVQNSLLEQEYDSFYENILHEYKASVEDSSSDLLSPKPEFYFNKLTELPTAHLLINEFDAYDTNENIQNSVNVFFETTKNYFSKLQTLPIRDKHSYLKWVFKTLKQEFASGGTIFFATKNNSSKKEIVHFIESENYSPSLLSRIHFKQTTMDQGFYYENEKVLVISESDLFVRKVEKARKSQRKNVDLFAEQFASLSIGDYVIHSTHGIGKYIGLESMDFGGVTSDYLILQYANADKVYLPAYKLNLIQKHADSTSELKPDSLRTNKFSALKDRAKKSIKKLAFDLLKLQAQRASQKAYSFSPPDDLYHEFELSFPFEETPDQTNAIEDVLTSMQKSLPMDHLVCGDVGFGKTEIAMRAAFKAVEDKKQVAVLVPTTILALQHYNSFVKRFKNFPVNIEFLSRFKSAKESKDIIEKLNTGELDIIIGTHKLLSDKIKYRDLGLVVVDEEQRFGVSHKEKLKLFKATVDFLTLTATPIPRTMQLAFLGIRELSLIKTPPPKRQSIKTYILKEDDYTIQSAIKRELVRAGQVLIVHNKVSDIENYTSYIKELVPEANIVFAHGQLPERELEKRMQDFFLGKYNVLIATTIIESGLDIPNANTLIVDRADTFGLSQLHQLRGRIGRSDKKAYAYFVIPKLRNISEIAQQRLKAMQTYADMGAGFHIANCDLEIRGAGDILGAQQSGHIESIGLELYTQLLNETIQELKGEKRFINIDTEIITPFPAYIPNHYIVDSGERLKQYKRISNLSMSDHIDDVRSEYEDVYGITPPELENLFCILQSRIALKDCAISQLSVVNNLLIFKFSSEALEQGPELRDIIVSSFIENPKKYTFSPDFKITYTHKEGIIPTTLVGLCKEIAQKIAPC